MMKVNIDGTLNVIRAAAAVNPSYVQFFIVTACPCDNWNCDTEVPLLSVLVAPVAFSTLTLVIVYTAEHKFLSIRNVVQRD